MAKEYYYFVCGLPEIKAEDTKLLLTPMMFLHAAQEQLNREDYNLLRLLLIPDDLLNLVSTLHNKNNWLDESIVTKEEWQEAIKELKHKTEPTFLNVNLFHNSLPEFILDYLSKEVQNPDPTPEHILLRDLYSMFYDWVEQNCDGFLSEWFRFDSELRNIIIALNCRKHKVPLQNQLIGNNYLTSKLMKSNAADFGLGNEYPMLEVISRLNENTDIIAREKGFDALRWKWLESRTFFDYFTIPRLLGYFIRIRIIYRWIHLSSAIGEKRFHQVLHDLETSFEFPEEFAFKR